MLDSTNLATVLASETECHAAGLGAAEVSREIQRESWAAWEGKRAFTAIAIGALEVQNQSIVFHELLVYCLYSSFQKVQRDAKVLNRVILGSFPRSTGEHSAKKDGEETKNREESGKKQE